MEKINSPKQLQETISQLQLELVVQAGTLEDQVKNVFNTLKPVNLIKSTVQDVKDSPILIDDLIGIALGVSSGYITKRMIVKKSNNPVRHIAANIAQMILSQMISKYTGAILSIGQAFFSRIKPGRRYTALH